MVSPVLLSRWRTTRVSWSWNRCGSALLLRWPPTALSRRVVSACSAGWPGRPRCFHTSADLVANPFTEHLRTGVDQSRPIQRGLVSTVGDMLHQPHRYAVLPARERDAVPLHVHQMSLLRKPLPGDSIRHEHIAGREHGPVPTADLQRLLR